MADILLHADVRAAIVKFEREVGRDFVQRQLPFATALALTQTAKAVLADERTAMQTRFDRPRAYTLGSLRMVPADKATLTAEVRTKDGAGQRGAATYLQAEATGGPRRRKAFETKLEEAAGISASMALVPARGLPRDATGNVSRGTIGAALRGVAKQGKGMGKRGTFAAKPGNKAGLRPGLYQRTGRGTVRALFLLMPSVTYRARYPFREIGGAAAERRFPATFAAALDRAIRTGRRL